MMGVSVDIEKEVVEFWDGRKCRIIRWLDEDGEVCDPEDAVFAYAFDATYREIIPLELA